MKHHWIASKYIIALWRNQYIVAVLGKLKKVAKSKFPKFCTFCGRGWRYRHNVLARFRVYQPVMAKANVINEVKATSLAKWQIRLSPRRGKKLG